MQRILIIGNAGSGKSTFAKALAQKTGLPLVHLDQLYWNGHWEHVSRDTFDALLQAELVKPQWIIDGNFNRTLPHRLQYCDHVFFFDMPTWLCLWGITKRLFSNHGKTREDMGGSCPERLDKNKLALYKNVLSFNRQHRKEYYKRLENSNITVFRNRRQVREFLK